jgi:putative protease
MKKPELLSPAGSMKSLRHALACGADAVYAGQPRYSRRVRNNEFHGNTLSKGIQETHQRGKQFFLTVNTMPRNSKVKTFVDDLTPVIKLKPDALIMADPGLIMIVRERWPEMPIHLSVQANTVNYAGVQFWQSIGIKRIILSRELSLDEMEEIRQQCPNIELEVFVHGALCIAYSGRCLLSGYFNHRDPNQGMCTNACRWEYKTHEATETIEGIDQRTPNILSAEGLNVSPAPHETRHPLANNIYLLEEKKRPGELMPIMEDEHGTYIMNSKDLRAIEHVQRLVKIGIDCLKIEGRTKSHYYAARTAQAYRQAIDDAAEGNPFDPELLGILGNLAHRGYTDGFYQRHHSKEQQNYLQGSSQNHQQQFVGEITHVNAKSGMVDVEVKNRFQQGDRLEVIDPKGNQDIILEHIEDLSGNRIEVAPGSGHHVRIPLPSAEAGVTLSARYL